MKRPTQGERQGIHLWSTLKANNPAATPDPERDGFRYAWQELTGNPTNFRDVSSTQNDRVFGEGARRATAFYEGVQRFERPTKKRLYRAIGLDESSYRDLLSRVKDGYLEMPPASWTSKKSETEQFGQTQSRSGLPFPFDKRVVFSVAPGAPSWAIGQSAKTRSEKEHVAGGRFEVRSVRFPDAPGEPTEIALRAVPEPSPAAMQVIKNSRSFED